MSVPIVILTERGLRGVLSGAVGMSFAVDSFTPGVAGLVAHVRDYRYPGTHRPYQIWSLGCGDYEVAIREACP